MRGFEDLDNAWSCQSSLAKNRHVDGSQTQSNLLATLWQPVEQSIQGFFDLAVVASEEARDALVQARDALVPADGVEDRKPKKRNK